MKINQIREIIDLLDEFTVEVIPIVELGKIKVIITVIADDEELKTK